MELTIILSIVFIHECGHYVMARIFRWRIESIMLWVFGGVMNTEEHGNKGLREEALVTIAGPVQHLFIYFGIYLLALEGSVPLSIIELILSYNTAILFFNLLPIWPLDGGKLLFLGLSALFPYRKAYHAIIIFSMVASLTFIIVQSIFFPFTLSTFFLMAFLFLENRTEWRQRFYVFVRFLLNRYEDHTPIKGVQPIVVPHQSTLMHIFSYFKREKKHPVYVTFPNKGRKTIDENDCLRSYFYDKHYDKTIGEIVDTLK